MHGSSPRAWGIRQPRSAAMRSKWFIPTCVGNTLGKRRSMVRNSVHPHVRGEYAQLAIAQRSRYGSSPRAWGIPQVFTVARKARRFIPTCVGNTRSARTAALTWTVHPHVRGEYPVLPVGIDTVDGSSPRAWGIRPARYRCPVPDRFIPTCVRNTWSMAPENLRAAVHPHVRGEYTFHEISRPSRFGSSPRAWGILQDMPVHTAIHRFIPTCVGNTWHRRFQDGTVLVHPHVRGEYIDGAAGKFAIFGSSPRAWGIRDGRKHVPALARFIPTCVGNT